jgi:SAM-dependent methyltransferase
MGINPLMLAWLDRLAESGVFRGATSLFELGPQDLFVSRRQLEHVAMRRLPEAAVARIIKRVFEYCPSDTQNQRAFYQIFGFADYESCDANDKRAEHRIDLNAPLPPLGRFDCVTNFGTAEHVFNIGVVFASVHQLLAPGGIALHVLPCCGDVNHGFYTVHPALYFDIARANSYDIVDIRYIDNMNVRCLEQTSQIDADPFDALPISLSAEWTQIQLSRRITDLYATNATARNTREMLSSDFNSYVVDYCFVALRKPTTDRDFVVPMQTSSAGWTDSGH